ncbi:MAG: acyl-CoA desaturase [Chitinophagaceae bacterium]|nr:acyl-CoA desaturase [Chitinophagaceae bacterium]
MSVPKFPHTGDAFYLELKKRVGDYFSQAGIASTGNFQLYFKAILLVISYIALYTWLVFFTPATFIAIIGCAVLGILTAAIGFNVMHDGAHGSFSQHPWLNKLAGLSLNVLGANNYLWKTKHNVIHHAYTNVDGVDDDIDARPFLRLCETQKFYKVHRFQHLYFWAAYSLLYLWWIFFTDYRKYFAGRIGPVKLKKMNMSEHLTFWGFKVLHMAIFVVLPILVVGVIPWLVGFLTLALVAGFVLSIVFQLAHTVQDTEFPQADPVTNKLGDEWAIHQLKTTANFSNRNRLISWWVGGLNFQIEHHLFPRISHVHYPAISKLIRQTCAEFGIQYIEYPRLRYAVASHVAFLRQMGKP